MARMLRIEYEGALYHVLCRGNAGQGIYRNDTDREIFLKTLEECTEQTGWRIHAYVLMSNHYHLLIETPEANLVAGMKWFQGTYTQRFNARHKRRGHLYQGRYKSLIIDPDEPEYFRIVSDYIHLNPVRAHLLDLSRDELTAYAWSSYLDYLKPPSRRPAWLTVQRVLSSTVHADDSRRGRNQYRQYMQERAQEELDTGYKRQLREERKPIERGWLLGAEAFRDRLLDRLDDRSKQPNDNFRGSQRAMHGEKQAEKLISKALKVLRLSEDEFEQMKASDIRKQSLAWLLKKKTIVTGVWIAERLRMGHRVNVSRGVSRIQRLQDRKIDALKKKLLQCTG